MGAILTGDEVVTGHALLRDQGPQLLSAFFSHGDQFAAIAVLESLDAEVILPGHGEPLRRSVDDAVREVRERDA